MGRGEWNPVVYGRDDEVNELRSPRLSSRFVRARVSVEKPVEWQAHQVVLVGSGMVFDGVGCMLVVDE